MTAGATERESTMTVEGADLFVRERGVGAPILLLNGLGSNADMWGAVEDELSTIGRTVVFDMPGSGRSPTPRAPLSISDHADLALALLDELGHAQADVVGFSLGGMVAQQLARNAGDRVRRLTLVGTGCGLGGMPPTLQALMLLSMPFRYHSERVYHGTNHLLTEADRRLLARLSSLSASRLRHPPPLLGYAYQLAAGSLWSSLQWLETIRVPTLVLVGSVDQVVPPANGYQLARLLPTSRLHVVDGGHLCLFDPEGPAVELVKDFFASPAFAESTAWVSGAEIVDDDLVEAQLSASSGAYPHRVVAAAYRRFVQRRLGYDTP
jgi:pimeloyl-ACP methyl ester carboxylesterase